MRGEGVAKVFSELDRNVTLWTIFDPNTYVTQYLDVRLVCLPVVYATFLALFAFTYLVARNSISPLRVFVQCSGFVVAGVVLLEAGYQFDNTFETLLGAVIVDVGATTLVAALVGYVSVRRDDG